MRSAHIQGYIAIVAHAQYVELNELKWRQYLRSKILQDNDYSTLTVAKTHIEPG